MLGEASRAPQQWGSSPGGTIQEERSWRCLCLRAATDTEASPLQSEILRGLFPISARLGCSCCSSIKKPGVLALNPAGSWAHSAGAPVGMG